jgi:hypothetical protein
MSVRQGNPARALGAGPSGCLKLDAAAGVSADHDNGLIRKFRFPLDEEAIVAVLIDSSGRPPINCARSTNA